MGSVGLDAYVFCGLLVHSTYSLLSCSGYSANHHSCIPWYTVVMAYGGVHSSIAKV